MSRIVEDERAAIDGEIEVFDPPNRLVLTWHVLYDAEMAEEPPSRVEWLLTPATEDDSVTRVTLRHGDLALSPRTWANAELGWVGVIDSLKTWLETGQPLPAVNAGNRQPGADVQAQWHRTQAIDANNSVWELLDGRSYSADDADDLLQRAYAAAYHWHRAANTTAVNAARASWLLSRVHAVLGQGDLALHHAQQCAAHVSAAGDEAADFDQGYVHESTARALACLGRLDEAIVELQAARAAVIADDGDRSILEADLASEPWFGLTIDA